MEFLHHSLEPPLGLKDMRRSEALKKIVAMDIEADEDGYIYFNELLFKVMKRVYGVDKINNIHVARQEIETIVKCGKARTRIQKSER